MIVDGAGRETDELKDIGWPIWTRAITPRGTHTMFPGRKEELSINMPIQGGGVVVNHGDFSSRIGASRRAGSAGPRKGQGMKTAIVTGGTRGIGAGVSRALANAGWQVIAASPSEVERDAFTPHDSIALQNFDVTDDASVTGLFGGLDRLDGLVNCAGILRRGEGFDLDVFRRVLDVNLTGTIRCCLAARDLLAASGGAIVNTASMLSTFGGPLVPAYSASKGGVAQLTKALAGAWAAEGIRLNAVAPGWIETGMTEGLRDDPARTDGIMARTPMKRWGQPSEVGALVSERRGEFRHRRGLSGRW